MTLLLAVSEARWIPLAWTVLAFVGFLGLLALLSPRWFSAVAMRGGHWVDTERVLNKLNTRIDIDAHILPHSRVLGGAVVAAVGLLGWMLYR